MLTKLNTANLGDYCKIDSGFAFKSAQFTQNKNDVCLVKGSNLGHRKIDWEDSPRWNSNEFDKLSRYKLVFGDVVIAMDRPIVSGNLKFAWIQKTDPKALLVQRVARLRSFDSLDQNYLRFVIADPAFKAYIDTITTGVNVPHISGPDMRRYKFPLPPLPTQQKIAQILSAYDDLIENNLKRIKLLEEMAQITYEQWFVRMKFPSHETTPINAETGLPEGWSQGKVIDLFELQRGFDLPIQKREEGSIPIIASTGITGFHSNFKVKDSGVITGRSGTIGKVIYVRYNFWPLNTTLWVKKYHSCGSLFVKHFLEFFNLVRLSGGSAVPSLDRKAVHIQKIIIPPAKIMDDFEQFAKSVYELIDTLSSKNTLLKEARDILLPRLMTGMIDVDKIKRPKPLDKNTLTAPTNIQEAIPSEC